MSVMADAASTILSAAAEAVATAEVAVLDDASAGGLVDVFAFFFFFSMARNQG